MKREDWIFIGSIGTVIAVSLTSLTYVLLGFIFGEYDIAKWWTIKEKGIDLSGLARFFFLFLSISFSAIAIGLFYEIYLDYLKKEGEE